MDPYKHRPSSSFNGPLWSTNSGAPVWNNNNSLTVGSRGTNHFFPGCVLWSWSCDRVELRVVRGLYRVQ
uniref:Uncharacterized protein n=1 Tax=Leersia perrieri TaxID=77586 RepID=A0A0D9VP56_9ORYZ